jgi:hypothetical protein
MLQVVLQYCEDAVVYGVWLFSLSIAIFGVIYMIEQAWLDISSRELTILGPSLVRGIQYVPLISLLVVCGSIYFEDTPRTPPTPIAEHVVSPVLIVVAAMLVIVRFWRGHLPSKYLDGAALLALGGALLRLRGAPLDLFTH